MQRRNCTIPKKQFFSAHVCVPGNTDHGACGRLDIRIWISGGVSTFASATGAAAFFASLCDINLHVLLGCIKLFVMTQKNRHITACFENNENMFRKSAPYNPRISPRASVRYSRGVFPGIFKTGCGTPQKKRGGFRRNRSTQDFRRQWFFPSRSTSISSSIFASAEIAIGSARPKTWNSIRS